MAIAVADPLQQQAANILQIINDPEDAKRRMTTLQAKLEEQNSTEMRQVTRALFFFVAVIIVSFGVMRYLHVNEDGGDTREL